VTICHRLTSRAVGRVAGVRRGDGVAGGDLLSL
jgi:hypothetical protein